MEAQFISPSPAPRGRERLGEGGGCDPLTLPSLCAGPLPLPASRASRGEGPQ